MATPHGCGIETRRLYFFQIETRRLYFFQMLEILKNRGHSHNFLGGEVSRNIKAGNSFLQIPEM